MINPGRDLIASDALASFKRTIIFKLNWMGQQLREKNEACELEHWIKEMASLLELLVSCPKIELPSQVSKEPHISPRLRSMPTLTKQTTEAEAYDPLLKWETAPPLSNSQVEWSRKLPPPPGMDTDSCWEDEIHSQGVGQQDMSIRCGMKTSQKYEELLANGNSDLFNKRHQDQIRAAILSRLKDAGKDHRWYTANQRRLKKLLNSIEQELGLKMDKLLRGKDQRAITLQKFNDFFGKTILQD